MMYQLLVFFQVLVAALILVRAFFRWRLRPATCAFFHPYCNAGGGGERVLWCAINAMQQRFEDRHLDYVVYTGDRDASGAEILAKARERFNVTVDARRVRFVFLRTRRLLEADLYPRFTLFFQSFAGLLVGFEALCRLSPSLFIDTMGYSFTYPLFRFIGAARVAAYVHYPTISTDMIGLVEARQDAYNNAAWIAHSAPLSAAKLWYYRIFAQLYRLTGRCAHVVMVNSTWTYGHISHLWARPNTAVVYPPCDVQAFTAVESRAEALFPVVKILSIGQIRPEKNHRLQLESFALLKKALQSSDRDDIQPRLVIVGGCRHKDDLDRADSLRAFAAELGVEDAVDWRLNIPFDELKKEVSEALLGVHTMWNEHFGISVVEGMAAGQLMVASDSGGPRMDILRPVEGKEAVGFLAATAQQYADCMRKVIVEMSAAERAAMRERARAAAERFNERRFGREWCDAVAPIVLL